MPSLTRSRGSEQRNPLMHRLQRAIYGMCSRFDPPPPSGSPSVPRTMQEPLAPLHWFRESLARTLLRMDIADQKKAVTDLAFEVYHFRCYSRLYRDSQLALVLRQAVIYSLLLHVRVLLGFFSGRPVQEIGRAS